MLIAIVPVIVAIVGALIYSLSAHPKVSEIGRLCFLAGMIGFCVAYASHTVRVG